jgi:hypothetical protein
VDSEPLASTSTSGARDGEAAPEERDPATESTEVAEVGEGVPKPDETGSHPPADSEEKDKTPDKHKGKHKGKEHHEHHEDKHKGHKKKHGDDKDGSESEEDDAAGARARLAAEAEYTGGGVAELEWASTRGRGDQKDVAADMMEVDMDRLDRLDEDDMQSDPDEVKEDDDADLNAYIGEPDSFADE